MRHGLLFRIDATSEIRGRRLNGTELDSPVDVVAF
jgi:hypothetical protein